MPTAVTTRMTIVDGTIPSFANLADASASDFVRADGAH